MRLRLSLAAAVLLIACSAFAQQSNVVSVFATNPGFESSSLGTHFSGGLGLALNHFWTPAFSTELIASRERSFARYEIGDYVHNSIEVVESRYTTNSADLLAQYHFRNDSRWKPYIGGGLRYANRPGQVFQKNEFDAEFDAGVMWNLTRHFGLTFDGRVFTRASFRPSAGLSWRF